jgi:hypothetical protein
MRPESFASVFERLNANTKTVHSSGAELTKGTVLDRARVGFKGDLGVRCHGKCAMDGFKNTSDLALRQNRRRATAEEDGVYLVVAPDGIAP